MSYTPSAEEFSRVIKKITELESENGILRRRLFVARRLMERYGYEYGDPRTCRECKAKVGQPHGADCGVGIVEGSVNPF